MAIDDSSIDHAPHPNPALARLERLVGAWDIRGRTFNSATDDIRGKVVVDWLPGDSSSNCVASWNLRASMSIVWR